jgi:hypothetical protein
MTTILLVEDAHDLAQVERSNMASCISIPRLTW